MSEWLKTLVGYMVIVSITMQMLPNRKYEQYVKVFTGFLLVVLLIQPILKLGAVDEYLENKISEFVTTQEKMEREIGRESDAFIKKSEQCGEEEILGIREIEKIEVVIGD